MTAGGTVDGGFVRELDSGGESGDVGSIDVGGDICGGLDRVITGDVDRADEGVEVACRNIVGIVPIDHTTGPLNGALGTSLDACRPDTDARIRSQLRLEYEEGEEVAPDLNTSGGGRVTDNPGRIDGVGLLQGTNYASVDQPCQGIGLPVDLSRKWI